MKRYHRSVSNVSSHAPAPCWDSTGRPPMTPEQDTAVSQTQPTWTEGRASLKHTIQLDDYPGPERVYFLLSDEPIEAEQIEDALEQRSRKPLSGLDHLPSLPGAQHSVMLLKERSAG